MQFRTVIPVEKYDFPIDYQSKILSLGSCFAENMSEKFEYFKFQNTVNPFGIIFNAVSLEKIIKRSIQKDYYTEKDIFFHNDLWHCFEVHSELSNANKEVFLKNLNQLIESTSQQIAQSTHLIITLGTSWVYRNTATNEIVANCHKVPQKQFTKELLSVDQNEKSLQNIVALIRDINPNCKFIFTVSPVRHIKDGFIENNLSKSHLFTAIHKIINYQLPIVNYFPSYEIMMDELRDYRFYAEDMLHPNQTAIDYIWIKFFENYVKEEEFPTMQQVCDIQKALHHRPFNPSAENHLQFLEKVQGKIVQIQQKFPHIRF
ncbi:MAG: GSCFA domain-containing protein [Flavobacterium sp.]|nr:GSCFA domain-containing protein [Flavobacterium sp.]